MNDLKLGAVEAQFAQIIWDHEPLPSRELVKLCEQHLAWSKSTTYTVLRKLCQRGIFKNEAGMVSSVISQQEFQSMQSEQFVEDTFKGSLPAFIAAFTQRKTISQQEADEIRKMIEEAAGRG